ncbi:MAG: prolyl oligopeptidase family serine peptidase [Bacteroidota bacterium]
MLHATALVAQPATAPDTTAPLTVAEIMQDPATWIGAWPTDVFWTDRGDAVYFRWNPKGSYEADSLFRFDGGAPEQVTTEERRALPPRFGGWHADRLAYSPDLAHRVFARDGDLYRYALPMDGGDADQLTRLTATPARESDPRFTPDGTGIVFERDGNVFRMDRSTGTLAQLTDLRSGTAPSDREPSQQDAYLAEQQTRLFDVLREQDRRDTLAEAASGREVAAQGLPTPYYYGGKRVSQLQLSPGGRYATFVLADPVEQTRTSMTDYVTVSGYAEEISARPKVGRPGAKPVLHIQDLTRDTTYAVDLTTLPGAFDAADYKKEYRERERGHETDSSRVLLPYGPFWSPDGAHAVVIARADDNKDRWIARLDAETGAVTLLDRQRDEAWIAGPGIPWFGFENTVGWIPERDGSFNRFWFQSEATGYSHLYDVDVTTGTVTQRTRGDFEVFDPQLTRDGQTWVFQSSEGSPHERHVYRMSVDGGVRTKLTSLRGRNDFAFSPDGQTLALLYSAANYPPEIYVQELTRDGARAPVRVTDSPTEDWLSHGWRAPEIIEIPASDGALVPARIYRPEEFGAEPNGAAVLFVHGAGYLQNVHRWWSSYFREYMFHHLLAQRGYVVLDLDFRASAGYGRDWRTAIYRHMGGRDLQDYVDASRWLGLREGIPSERVAIYGGSYGGFIALMALFTEPEHFGGGAALRSVTDWAHYNHVYTSNILNTPAEDPVAFARSSPIEFADGLEDPLLMCHGLIDDNVQPQDIFRLSQRLIELGKEDWELAIYPVEPHGFTEPTSWTDEYRRILKLIEESVGPERGAEGDTAD